MTRMHVLKGLSLAVLLSAVLTGCATGDQSATAPEITMVADGVGDPPELPLYEIPEVLYTGGENPPAGFDSSAAVAMRNDLSAIATIVSADFDAETGLYGRGDARSAHISEACQGERAAYSVAVLGFVGSSVFGIGAAAFGNVPLAWTGLRAAGVALGAVNVARAAHNGCTYREGQEWDAEH